MQPIYYLLISIFFHSWNEHHLMFGVDSYYLYYLYLIIFHAIYSLLSLFLFFSFFLGKLTKKIYVLCC